MNLNEQLIGILNDLQGVWTESALILGAIAVLIIGLFNPNSWVTRGVYCLVLIAAFILGFTNESDGLLMVESLLKTTFSRPFHLLFIAVAMLLLIYQRDKKHAAEFYFFILAMLVGSIFMTQANSLLIVYLSLELTSFASYILTNFSFRKLAFEASIKYLLFGALSSAIMLFGIGLIYGSTGSLLISAWSEALFSELVSQVGFVLFLMGIFFKVSIAPSHIWVPATYQTAPADATAFMSIVPKLAGLILLQRIFQQGVFVGDHWVYALVWVLGMITIIVGTLGALRQQQVRRMIGFGAIAHSGFLLPLVMLSTDTAATSFWYYAVIYTIMNVSIFYLVDIYERGGIQTLADYAKIKSNGVGIAFTLLLVSLVGLPPLAGFTAKFFLFTSLWEGYQASLSSYLLVYLAVAVLATAGSLFFYLQIPKQLFLSQTADSQSIDFRFSTKFIATLFCIVLLLLFFAPQLVMEAQQLLNNVHE